MLPTHQIELCLQRMPPQLRDIVLELRSLIVSVAPSVTEICHPKGFTYYLAERGGPVSAGLCQIGLHRDHVRLAFVHGVFLPDPKGLLEGDRKYKRHVRIYSYERAPWEDLKNLVTSSSQFDPYALNA
jgi:hypothetical protein